MQDSNEKKNADAAPFIIWTFRRTGGTNLGSALFARSEFVTAQHEPFNEDRQFGWITTAAKSGADEKTLREALAGVCAEKWLMKHCVEVVPNHVNEYLADASVAAGYRHVFLYRRQPLSRLLSLHFASESGVWGKAQAGKVDQVDDAIFDHPIPIDELLLDEKRCRRSMRAVYDHLLSLGAKPALVTFEDIYADKNAGAVRQRLFSLFDYLGLSEGEESDGKLIESVVGGGNQGTRHQYSRFVNYEEMVTRVAEMGEFDLLKARRFILQKNAELPAEITYAEIWNPVAEANPDTLSMAGLVFAEQYPDLQLSIEDPAGVRPIEQGLPSPRVAARFAGFPAASSARFRVSGLHPPESAPVRLLCTLAPGMEPIELAQIVAVGGASGTDAPVT